MESLTPRQTLSPIQLHRKVDESLKLSELGITGQGDPGQKPYRYIIRDSARGQSVSVRIYAWNITHGGGPARARDEYRIQLTGVMPEQVGNEITTILGWSEIHGVFVAWDPSVHDHRTSASPSLQVRESVMLEAQRSGSATGTRASGDDVFAFRPELLAAFCVGLLDARDLSVDRPIGGGVEQASESFAEPFTRKLIERRLVTAHRTWDFSVRVRRAYGHMCTICGLGLGLVEGAHIVPVAWPGSTDETSNGLALCRNHHAAYDKAIISVSPNLRVEVSRESLRRAKEFHVGIDLSWLEDLDGKRLRIIPKDHSERPDPEFLVQGQTARNFRI